MSTTLHVAPDNRDVRAVSLKPTFTFLLLTTLFSLPWWILLARFGMNEHYRFVLALMWSPGLASLLTAAIFRIPFGSFGWRWPAWIWIAAGYLIPIGYSLVAYGLVWSSGLGARRHPFLPAYVTAPPWFVLVFVALLSTVTLSLAGALGEEIGWRGFLVPQLAPRLGYTGLSLSTGAIWALWHIPFLLWGGYNAGTPVWFALPCFTVMVIAMSFVMTWARLGSRSLWPCALLHASHNQWIQGYFTPGTVNTGHTQWWIDEFGAALPVTVGLLALYLWSRGRGIDVRAESSAFAPGNRRQRERSGTAMKNHKHPFPTVSSPSFLWFNKPSLSNEAPMRRGLPLALSRILFFVVLALCSPLTAQQPTPKKIVTSETDLPRFSFPLTVSAADFVVADDAAFAPFLHQVHADLDSVLDGYDIQDKATLRQLITLKLYVNLLEGDAAGAHATLDRSGELQEKPAAKATNGLLIRSILAAQQASGSSSGPAFHKAFTADFTARVDALPWDITQDRVRSLKSSFQTLSPGILTAELKTNVDPVARESGTIDMSSASEFIGVRELIKIELPLQTEIIAVLTPYIRAHQVQKPDIWPAREVTLAPSDKLTPVRIAIWDSGVDTALYPNQLFTDPRPGTHGPHGLAYDLQGKLFAADLQPLTAEQKAGYADMLAMEQGDADLDDNIESPRAAAAVKFYATAPADKIQSLFKEELFMDQWMHGTHVAGIAVRGNPAARLVVVQFNDSFAHLPFMPTVEWANQFKIDFEQVGDYLRENNVRVVNASWSDSVSEIETWLSKTSPEKDPSVRKQTAAKIYAIWKEAVEETIKRAPNTLFVCAAGNSNSNAGFNGDVPASLHFPNLITVGAVDQAGEETSFTSYGDTVVLDADGFEVDSLVPGGTHMRLSGTSMASPNVVNLAAKLIALDPSLTPQQTIALIEKGAETSADGRRHLINPKATVALLQQQPH